MNAHFVTAMDEERNRFKAIEVEWGEQLYYLVAGASPQAPPTVLGPDGVEVVARDEAQYAPAEFRKAAAEMVIAFIEWQRQWRHVATPAMTRFLHGWPPQGQPTARTTAANGEEHNWMVEAEASGTHRGF